MDLDENPTAPKFDQCDAMECYDAIMGAAESNRMSVTSGPRPAVVLNRDTLTIAILSGTHLGIQQSVTEGQFGLWCENAPIHATGATAEEAENAMVEALVDYAEAWFEDLRNAPNHAQHAGLATLVVTYAGDRDALRKLLFDRS